MAASRRASARRCSKARIYDCERPARDRELHGLLHAARGRPAVLRRSASTVTPCPSNPLGIKGCGEAGAIAAPPAVINAITDALGHEDVAMPATPAGGVEGGAEDRAEDCSAAKVAAPAAASSPFADDVETPCTPSPITPKTRPAGRLAAGQGRRRQDPGRRPDAAADHEAAPRLAGRLVDLGKVEGLSGIELQGPLARRSAR